MAIRLVHRFDAGGEILVTKTPEGFLVTEGAIAKPGVMPYEQADGSVILELVDEDVLNDPVANATLVAKAFTLEHPEVDVTPDNWKELAEGVVSGWRYDKKLYASFSVNSREALDAIKAGKVQLSPGYVVEIDDTPGEHPEFGRYDTRQMPGRRYNHVAGTDEARGGPDLQIRTDSAKQKRIDMTLKKRKDASEVDPQNPANPANPPADDMSADAPASKKDMADLTTKVSELIDMLKTYVSKESTEVDDKADADDMPADDKADADDMPADKADADDMPADDAPPAVKADSAKSRAAWYNARRKIEDVAAQRGIDISALADKDNAVLKRHIVRSLRPDLDAKRLDSRAAVDTAFDLIATGPSASDFYPTTADFSKKADAADGADADDGDMRKRLNKNKR